MICLTCDDALYKYACVSMLSGKTLLEVTVLLLQDVLVFTMTQEVLVLCLTPEEEDAAICFKDPAVTVKTFMSRFPFPLLLHLLSIFFVFNCFKHISFHQYTSSYLNSVLSFIRVTRSLICILALPHYLSSSLGACPILPLSPPPPPPLLHYSLLSISPPIPVFLVSG